MSKRSKEQGINEDFPKFDGSMRTLMMSHESFNNPREMDTLYTSQKKEVTSVNVLLQCEEELVEILKEIEISKITVDKVKNKPVCQVN